LKAESLLRTSRTSDSRCAIIEGPSGNALPLLVESVSQADETFTQDNSAATRLTYDIVALPDSDGTLEVDMEVPSELEEAVLTTGQLIRMLKLKREPNINPSPPISTLECRDLVLAFGLATLPPPSSIQYWSWSDMTVQKQPKMEQVIYFVDDFEREFTFPLSEVKTWQVNLLNTSKAIIVEAR
jgi:hypothetical protein